MKKKIVLFLMLFLILCAAGVTAMGQEAKSPVTKEEILRLLKQPPGQRSEQGDLAGAISERGIAFKVNDQTLTELKKAGAKSFLIDAILQASQNSVRPQLQLPPETQPTAQTTGTKEVPQPQEAPKEEDSPEVRAAAIARLPLIEQARYHAADFMEELPNFVATQIVTRSIKTPEKKDWQVDDKLEIELTYRVKDGEKFKLQKVNGKPTSRTYESLGGSTSTGEFGSMLSALFASESHTEFKELRHEKFKSRETVVYDFKVKKAFSSNRITDRTSGRSVTAAYSGTVWIDTETKRVLRLEQSSEDIQKGFPITMAESAVEYDWVMISGTRYLMPISAEMILGSDSERQYSRNVIELRNYHMFETDVKMILEKDPPK